ncbi:MAG: restriction endonuclease subunit S [Pseudomonas sp.]|nr:restriction endonuclease subunit S [Pseudomonas sp.]
MVPNGWDCQPLSNLLAKVIDYRGQSVPKASHGVPLITARNVRDGYLDFTSQEFVSDQDFVSWMKRGTPRAGDILFTTEAPLGKACRFPETGRFAVGQRTVTLRTNSRLDSDYLLYFILSAHGQNLIDLRSSGSTAKGIKSSELKKVKVSFPESVPEQKKIAQILSTWDKAITTTEQLLANGQQHKKALMQQLLTSKKRLLDKNGVRFSGEWKRVELGDLLNYQQPTPYLVESTEYSNEFSTPVLTAGKTFILGFTDEESGIFSEKLPAIIFDDFTTDSKFVDFPFKAKSSAMKILTAKKGVSTKYAYEAMQLLDFAVGGHQRHWISIYSRLVIPFPGKEEQQKIAAVLSTADQEITVLQQELNALKQEKKALMQQLLTGKRRVPLN